MLRITTSAIIRDSRRLFKPDSNIANKFGYNNKPMQIMDAFGDGSPIVYFYAHRLGYKGIVLETYELDVDCLYYSDGQYLIDSTKYYDNVTPANVLPNGIYEYEFMNSNEQPFYGENFQIAQEYIDGSNSFAQPKIKHFQNDSIVIFND